MKNKKNIALMWGIAVIPLILVALSYASLPNVVPIHFGFDGMVNSYGPKSTLWILGGIGPLLAVMFQYMPHFDPRRTNYPKFQKYYDLFAIGTELFMLAMAALLLTEILRPGTISIGRSVTALIAVLFILIGNMMGKVKPNYFFGLKNPWTLSDPDVWVRTHRLCGILWFVMGVVLLPCCLLLPEKVFFVLLMVGVLGSTVLVNILSCIWYRQKHPKSTEE